MPDSTPTTPADRTWAWALGALPAALLALVAGLAVTGAAAPSPLFDPGAFVRWGLPVVTVLMHSAAALAVGAFALCALVLPATPRPGARTRGHVARPSRATAVDGRAWARAARVGALASVVWALAQLAHLVLTLASVLGTLGGPGYGAQLQQFVTDIELGRNLMWSTVLTAVVALAAAAVASYTSAAWAGVLALVALVPLSLTGHAAGAASHELAVSSWWMHVGAVCVWAGGLTVLCLVAARLGRDLPDAAERYSRTALWCFVMVAYSGVVNSLIRLGSPADLVTDPYGRLLLTKIVLTVALGVAGWAHRRATIPAIRAGSDGGRRPGAPFWRLAGGEVLVMGAVIGVAVALGSSAPPVPQEPVTDASPTYLITRNPVPPYPTPLTYLTQWRLEPVLAFAAVAAVVVYLAWVVRLRRRGDTWPAGRTIAWVAGLLLFFWVTNAGPTVYGSVLFSAHMLEHMLLAMVVPIFVVLGAPVTLAVRALPHRRDGSRGPREWLLALVHSRVAGFFSNPVVAAVNFAGSLVVFYYTPLFELALTTHVGHILMVVHFTLAGYLFANALIGIDPGPARPSYPLRLLLLLATMGFHAFFGISIISQTSLLAADYFGWLGLPWGVDALADQEKGGAITWGVGELPTLALAIGVAVAWAKDDTRAARRSDRAADRDHDAELRAYNAMLAARAGQTPQEVPGSAVGGEERPTPES
ncbi:putative copper resistance protein D [Georgenia soli]|uniref:Putative copper resistance protein D n=1 Tax=Georgenia soli TaxID=638953 RepID=A0A2A9EMN5_9MICO|nr:bifunctional copper resistance protein CopD/cytochrome c oxidase assembly protein [Georgenia soli]PFG40063.1 putative copper resistance protein D [Georgenia soli]